MAEALSTEITVAFKGMQQNTEKMAQMLTQMKNVAMAVGITAVIFQALEPILKPLLMVMRAVFTMLFLPLIPLMKPFILGMKDVMKDMLEAQKAAADAGAGPMGQAVAGAGVFVSQVLSKIFSGLITGLISIVFGTGNETTGAEGFLASLLDAAGWGLLAVGITKWVLGKGLGTSLKVGILTLTIALAFAFIREAMGEENTLLASLYAFLAGIASYFGVAGLLKAVGVAAGTASGWGIVVGVLTLIFTLAYKFEWAEKMQNFYQTVKDWILGKTEHLGNKGMAFDKADYVFNVDAKTDLAKTTMINFSNESLLSASNTTSLTYGINTASTGFNKTLTNSSKSAVNNVISELNRIPKNITTVHNIVTVYSSSGSSSKK